MYAIIEKTTESAVDYGESIVYAKQQLNGVVVRTEEKSATLVYVERSDAIWSLWTHRAEETDETPSIGNDVYDELAAAIEEGVNGV